MQIFEVGRAQVLSKNILNVMDLYHNRKISGKPEVNRRWNLKNLSRGLNLPKPGLN